MLTHRRTRHFFGGHARQHKDAGADNRGDACVGLGRVRLAPCQLFRALTGALRRDAVGRTEREQVEQGEHALQLALARLVCQREATHHTLVRQ